MILAIETSTEVCSAALIGTDGACLAVRESGAADAAGTTGGAAAPQVTGVGDHARLLAVYIDELLKEVGVQPTDLRAVAVAGGPGSYTGLRIGVSTAKGLCYGLGVPLIAISSLASLAELAIESGVRSEGLGVIEDVFSCPMIDARRMEVYAQVFDSEGKPLTEIGAHVIDENSFARWRDKKFCIFGTGAKKVVDTLPWTHCLEVTPSARGLARLAASAFAAGRFVDTAYYEPLYLKDFVATTPKKCGVRS